MKIKRKLVFAIIILALMSSVAAAGVVGYRGSSHGAEKDQVQVTKNKPKPGECEYKKGDNGKMKWECED